MTKNVNEVTLEDSEVSMPNKEEILENESCLIDGLLRAAAFKEETKKVQIKRSGAVLFEFLIRPLGEDEINDCRKAATKKNANPRGKSYGKIDGDVDIVNLRARVIYTATTEKYQKMLWDNNQIKQKLNCLSPMDVIDQVLKAGEKSWLYDEINDFSGFGDDMENNAEEYAKN